MGASTRPRQDGLLRALGHRNYRLFFTGQAVSLTGTWMTLAAIGWLVYRLTGDPLMLGLVGFFLHGPTFLLAPLGGVLSDRLDRRNILMACHVGNMVTVSALGALTLSAVVEVWQIFAACALLGVSKAFEMPARQALVAEVVEDRRHLPNAIALNSSVFHAAHLVGPLGAAVIIPLFGTRGEAVCFLLDALSYLPVIYCLLAMRLTPRRRTGAPRRLMTDMLEGFSYAFGQAPMRDLLLLVGAVAMFGMPYNTLFPVFAEQVLGGGPRTYGVLMAASGVGAFAGALHLAARRSTLGLARVVGLNVLVFSAALVGFALSSQLWLSLALLVVIGAAGLTTMVASNTILQTLVDEAHRGRLMSLFGMTFMGAMPLGALIHGKIASLYGAPTAVLVGAAVTAVAGMVFARRPAAHPEHPRTGDAANRGDDERP